MDDEEHEIERLRRERSLFSRLLDLSAQTEPEAFLRDALAVVVEATSARNGYIEIFNPYDGDGTRCWSTSHGFSPNEADDVRSHVSQGIIAEAVARGTSIETQSALLDPRFSDRGSVRARRIEAVLCVPISSDPPLGVLYLQGRNAIGPFDGAARQRAESFAHHFAKLAARLLERLHPTRSSDPTQAYRETLQADGLIGRSKALAGLLRNIALVSPLDVSVLLTGESGTGKSHCAKLIHQNGPRQGEAFVELNCGAIPEGLIESELFGALPGSHSTATAMRTGKVAAADRGTLFLDEIGDLSMPAQVKLLQLLQSRTYYPLGATQASQADVRVIAATNIDLEEAVAHGKFREDLFYRLHVLPVRVPSLAERREDIRELAEFFCDSASQRHRLEKLEFSHAAVHALESAPWPGNIRQLENAVVAAVIRASGAAASSVERTHVFPDPFDDTAVGSSTLTFQESTRRFQADLVRDALTASGWNVSETARKLDLARSHLYKLIRAFDLERK